MQDPTNSFSWLDHLALLMPPTGHVLVGAGVGTGSWVTYLQSRGCHQVTLVEADQGKFRHLQRVTANQVDWQLCDQVITSEAGTVTFHHASAAAESGLLVPETLQSLWPNLKTARMESREAITLTDLLAKAEKHVNWLWVDCLPALQVLAGGVSALAAMDVIIARVIVSEEKSEADSAALAPLESYLGNCGFRRMELELGRHPLLGHAIFVRDLKSEVSKLCEDLVESARLHELDRAAGAEFAVLVSMKAELYQAELQQVRQELQIVRGELERTQQAATANQEQATTADALLEERRAAAEQARNQLQNSQAELQQVRQELQVVRGELEKSQQAATANQEQATAADALLEEQRAAAERAGNQLHSSQTELLQVRQELQEVRGELEKSQQAATANQEQATAAEALLEEQRAAAEQVRIQFTESQSRLQQVRQELQEVRIELNKANQSATAAQKQVDSTDALLAEQRAAAEQAKNQAKLAQTELQNARGELAKVNEVNAEALKAAARLHDESKQKLNHQQESESVMLARQKILDEELTKAKAQIDLIKELLIKDQGT